jgi:hypothetical protein
MVGMTKKEKSVDKFLRKIYYNPKHAGSFSGVNTIKHAVGKRISSSDLENWLQSQDTYTLHKPVRHYFKRRRIIVSDIDEQWEADLVDLSGIAKYNKQFKYLLTVIDTLSKFAWAIPLKTKTGKEIVQAFINIFSQSKRKPLNLRTDKGGEFLNKVFQDLLKKEDIHFFTSNNEVKAAIVERFNRTLKTKMWKYFTKKNTRTYLPVLKDLLHSYNNTWHRSIKRKPSSVNEDNAAQVWHTLYGREKILEENVKFKFRVGDNVRISKTKMIFEKGYLPNWTTEIFTVKKQLRTSPPSYVLVDDDNEPIKGTFYEPELQKVKVTPDKLYKIERIVAEKGHGKNKRYHVKWEGYPSKFNSWVSHSQVKHL